MPGDERGSIDRHHNSFHGPRVAANAVLERQHEKKLKSDPLKLNSKQRHAVDDAVREVCRHRKWKLYAINVRTSHVQVVVAAIASAERTLNDFKSYSTREMRGNDVWKYEHSPWVDKGSKRKLWNEEHIYTACNYVNNGQGDDLPDFL